MKFTISGKTHYGWVRLNVRVEKIVDAVITGYAYETIPNKLITTGDTRGPTEENGFDGPDAALTAPHSEPASLGALALGSPGLYGDGNSQRLLRGKAARRSLADNPKNLAASGEDPDRWR